LLFEILDGTGRLAVIGVTWESFEHSFSLLDTTIYPNFEAFKTQRMSPDHEQYLAKKPAHKILIDAAEEGNLDLIRKMVEMGVDVDAFDYAIEEAQEAIDLFHLWSSEGMPAHGAYPEAVLCNLPAYLQRDDPADNGADLEGF